MGIDHGTNFKIGRRIVYHRTNDGILVLGNDRFADINYMKWFTY